MTFKTVNNLQDLIPTSDPLAFSAMLITSMPVQIGFYFDAIFDNAVTAPKLRKMLFKNQGWQLSAAGHAFLKKHYRHYICQSPQPVELTGKIILGMDRIGVPWYTRAVDIVVFNETQHFELQMFAGNLTNFVNFKFQ